MSIPGSNLFFIFLLSLSSGLIGEVPLDRIGRYTNQLCNEFKALGMHAFGAGGSDAHFENRETGLAFSYPIEGDISTARYWIISMIERYLVLVNADPLVRPYMHEYPFGPENCHFSIVFTPTKKAGNIAKVSQVNGELLYYRETEGENRRKIFYTEPYVEALKIYRNQQKVCLSNEN